MNDPSNNNDVPQPPMPNATGGAASPSNQPVPNNQFQQQQQQSVGIGSSLPMTAANTFLRPLSPRVESGFDEQRDSSGHLRRHWKPLDKRLAKIGPAGVDRRLHQIRRTLHQNGIAFSSYGDAAVRDKHLQLDPIPHLLPGAQWTVVEAALKQRATLLDRLLADLYGPRTLIQSGVLPPDVLFRHPHYQPPYEDVPPVGQRRLHFYAAELIRSPSGEWWVHHDRTDSPGGCGFALENRLAISRAFPSEFRSSNVRRLAPFFIALRKHLVGMAPKNRDNPHIAILSDGTGSRSYFEDSYLARYLGFTLVQSNDLVVRSKRVMLKTLAGLEPVDVIWRRQQGNQIDPLESGTSARGVSGILQVAREGNVSVVSTPGSGLVESPVFMAFMPQISRALLGADLLLPGVATWWAGNPQSRQRILDRIDELDLQPAYRERSVLGVRKHARKQIDVQTLGRDEKIKLIQNHPQDWVAREPISRSSASVWQDGQLKTGYLSMRSFLVASKNGWNALPGGLVRVSDTPDEEVVNPFESGGTKDAWILHDKPVEPITLLSGSNPIHHDAVLTSRSGGHLSSRMADNLCWLGRYFERAESATRLLRSVIARLTEESDAYSSVELPTLIRALAAEGRIEPGFAIQQIQTNMPDLAKCMSGLTLNRDDPNSLRSLVDLIVQQATGVRERLSTDAWRTVQRISNSFASDNAQDGTPAELLDLTNDLLLNLASFSGLINESMTRNHSRTFLNIGRRLENSLQIVSLLKHTLLADGPVTSELLEAVLEISDSIMTYRARYYANLQPAAVLDLLLLDETNPRSLSFQLKKLNESLELLPGGSGSGYSKVQRLAMDVLHRVRMVDIFDLGKDFAAGDREGLAKILDEAETQLPKIFHSISNQFLIHSGPLQQLVTEPFGKPAGS